MYVTNTSLLNIPVGVYVTNTSLLWKMTKYWKSLVDYKMYVD